MTIETLQKDIDQITLELSKYDKDLSNLENRINDVMVMCCHLGSMWKQADPLTAQKLQNLLYPNGIYWDKEIDSYRTITENAALAVIRKITESYKKEKEESPFRQSSLVNSCARGDSNPHVVRHQILSLARLPITPRAHAFYSAAKLLFFCDLRKSSFNSESKQGIIIPAGIIGPERAEHPCELLYRLAVVALTVQ